MGTMADLDPESAGACVGVLAALPEELGPWRDGARPIGQAQGLELLELELDLGRGAPRVLAAVAGVGKVRAARAATALIAAGARGALLGIGVCGALRRAERVGDLLLCDRAVQADLAVRSDRERRADPELLAAWAAACGDARRATFLTADRPVLSPWRRLRLGRAFGGPCVAEMETAAMAWVADAAGVPWAALRAVSDDVGLGASHGFAANFAAQAGRAAGTLPALVARLGG